MIYVGVCVMPRKEVLDSQGRAVEKTLEHQRQDRVQVRVGKYIELQLDVPTKEEALKKAQEITEFVLYNPLIEDYRLEIL